MNYPVLGIDPALNHVGISFVNGGPVVVTTTKPPSDISNQFQKMVFQRDNLRDAIFHFKPTYVGIEQPYVASFGATGGGHQSANMWAVYSMMLDVIRSYDLPVMMINISQFHALIERKRALTKTRIVELAKLQEPTLSGRRLDQHSADAYFISRVATRFWALFDGQIQPTDLTPDERDIFLSTRTGSKGFRAGIIWRAGDFWFDFRDKTNPTKPPSWLSY
jgi:hypothetical protein